MISSDGGKLSSQQSLFLSLSLLVVEVLGLLTNCECSPAHHNYFARRKASSIICRTFQGIGAAGTYSMAALITYEMVPKAKLPLYGGLNSVSVALATLMGPLFGGLINNNASWRWVFYLKYVEPKI